MESRTAFVQATKRDILFIECLVVVHANDLRDSVATRADSDEQNLACAGRAAINIDIIVDIRRNLATNGRGELRVQPLTNNTDRPLVRRCGVEVRRFDYLLNVAIVVYVGVKCVNDAKSVGPRQLEDVVSRSGAITERDVSLLEGTVGIDGNRIVTIDSDEFELALVASVDSHVIDTAVSRAVHVDLRAHNVGIARTVEREFSFFDANLVVIRLLVDVEFW